MGVVWYYSDTIVILTDWSLPAASCASPAAANASSQLMYSHRCVTQYTESSHGSEAKSAGSSSSAASERRGEAGDAGTVSLLLVGPVATTRGVQCDTMRMAGKALLSDGP